ncbi:17933_t:CDS:2, partial [Funneliformis geosporum]
AIGNAFFSGCVNWDWKNPQRGHRYIPINDRFPHLIGNIVIEVPIITKKCNVQLNSFIPDNLENCPFIAIVSKEIHNHLPPPPVTTPSNILKQLNEIIKHEDTLDLTARKLLTGIIHELLRQLQYDTSYIRNI